MKQLFRSGNYIIAIDGSGYQREFPIGKTIYTENANEGTFEIIEGQIEGSSVSIKLADAENWTDDLAVPYTEASMRTFLRDNTGFNTASGSSGAVPSWKYKAVISLSSDGEAMTNEVLFNNFPEGAPEINQLTTGVSSIDFIDGNPIAQKIDCGSNITDSNGDMWRFSTAFDGIQYQYYQGKSLDGGETWAFGDFDQTNDDALFCIITFEYYE